MASKTLVETVTVRVPLPQMASSSSSSSMPNPRKLARHVQRLTLYPSNLKRTAAPARVMFYQNGSWTDVPTRALDSLRSGFAERKPVVNAGINGSTFLFDFLRMLQIDSATGTQRSIAWIDEKGQCFFPKTFVSDGPETGSVVPTKIQIEIRVDVAGNKRQRDDPSAEKAIQPVDEEEVTSSVRHQVAEKEVTSMIRQRLEWPSARLLREDERAFGVVANMFLAGMKKVDSGVSVTGIRQCVRNGGPMDRARLEVFQKQVEITKAARGSANVVYAWYGASSEEIRGALSHGFGVPSKVSGPESYGVGLYLSHSLAPQASAGLAELDDNGEKHVVLCRVILGSVEKVEAGSKQCYPSSVEFDTGADEPKNPMWYVVWPTNMNRRVLPECVVSYKSSCGHLLAQLGGASAQTRYPVAVLFSKIRSSLPASKVQELSTLLDLFKAGKIPKNHFFKQFRSVTGDQLLLSAIQEMHSMKQGSA